MSTVVIDAAWLAARKPPYILDQPVTYQLRSDVVTPAGAFRVMVSNLILDLNGHAVTYDDSPPIDVANGGFESGDFTGWDVTKAPDAAVMPVTSAFYRYGWWGDHICQLVIPVGGHDVLASAPIAIPTPGIRYAATITPKADTGTTVTVSVVDAVTGTTLGSTTQNPNTIGNGGSIVVRFTPATVNPVKLVVDLTPPAGKGCTAGLDYAAMARDGAYGIDFNYNKSNVRITSSAPGGRIIQGRGRSTASHAVNNNYGISGFAVDGLTIQAGGQDTDLIYSVGSPDVTIRNNTLAASVDRMYNRQACFAFIGLVGPSTGSAGTYIVEGNTTAGTHQNSMILFGSGNFARVSIAGNDFRQDSSWTDGYGVQLQGVNNFEVAGNTIRPVSGRGILLQAVNGKDSSHGTIHDNDVEVQERANLEYPPEGLVAIAFRLRNYGGRISDISVRKNNFFAHTGLPGQDKWAVAARFNVWQDYGGVKGQMNDCNFVFEENHCKAIVVADNPDLASQDAHALSLATFHPGTGMLFRKNTLESNDCCLQLGCSDGADESDVTLIGNTLVKSAEGIAAIRAEDRTGRGFVGIEAGLYNGLVHDVRLIDTQYAGGADGTIKFVGLGPKDMSIGSTLTVVVVDGSGNPASGAMVTIADAGGANLFTGTTDATGAVAALIPLVKYAVPAGGKNVPAITTTPQPLKVTVGGKSTGVTLTGPASITVTTGEVPDAPAAEGAATLMGSGDLTADGSVADDPSSPAEGSATLDGTGTLAGEGRAGYRAFVEGVGPSWTLEFC